MQNDTLNNRSGHTTQFPRARSAPFLAALAATLCVLPFTLAVGDAPVSIANYNLGPDELALEGYDPVAYFTKNAAVKGDKGTSARHRGVAYYFASEEDRKLFTETPEKYLPTYGGWCATAMAKGEKVEIDPTNFKVTHGRLFLFYKGFWGNALKDWNKDEAGLTVKADSNWKKLAGE